MKLRFLGTRANTDVASPRHRRHSSALVSYHGWSIMIDCGAVWREAVWGLHPRAIVLAYAHPDHAWGLRDGAPCPVFATPATWWSLADFLIVRRRTVKPRTPTEIEGIGFEAFPVAHATLAPAVGYRVSAGEATIFYVPDAAFIVDRMAALDGVDVASATGRHCRAPWSGATATR